MAFALIRNLLSSPISSLSSVMRHATIRLLRAFDLQIFERVSLHASTLSLVAQKDIRYPGIESWDWLLDLWPDTRSLISHYRIRVFLAR